MHESWLSVKRVFRASVAHTYITVSHNVRTQNGPKTHLCKAGSWGEDVHSVSASIEQQDPT